MARALESGGTERQLAEMAKALHERGWDVHVGCFRDGGKRAQELRIAGIPIVAFPLTSFASPVSVARALTSFGRYVLRHKIQLTHSFDTPAIIFGTIAAKLFLRSCILTSQRSYRTLFKKWEHSCLRLTDRIADGVVVNCEAIRQHLIADEDVPRDIIHLCYNGLDTRKFFPNRDIERPEQLRGAFVIGTVCVLRPEKGLDVLLRAFTLTSPRKRQFRLVIVGSGPAREQLVHAAELAGVPDLVSFQADTDDVPSWMNRMDAFALASSSEAFSNALMEAMACGTPVIASRVGGNPELVIDGQRGLLFESGDAAGLAERIVQLADDSSLRERVAEQALKFVREALTSDAAAARMEEIYCDYLKLHAK